MAKSVEEKEKIEKEKKYISVLEKHADALKENKFYSMQRIDLLIISVSGAGVYVSLEIMKYLGASKYLTLVQINNYNIFFKISGLLFTLAIIVNFISQWAAYYESTHALQSTTDDIYAREHDINKTTEINESDCNTKLYKTLTNLSNKLSTFLMLLGLVCLIVFIWIIF